MTRCQENRWEWLQGFAPEKQAGHNNQAGYVPRNTIQFQVTKDPPWLNHHTNNCYKISYSDCRKGQESHGQ